MASHWRAGPAPEGWHEAGARDAAPPGRRPVHPLLAPSLTITCHRCPVRGSACDDCMVTVLLSGAASGPGPGSGSEPTRGWPLDPDESRAVHLLVRAGLVPSGEAATARARLEGRGEEHGAGAGERAVG